MQKSSLFSKTFLLIILLIPVIILSGCDNYTETEMTGESITTGNLMVKVNVTELFSQRKAETTIPEKVRVEIEDNEGNVHIRETDINDDLLEFSFTELKAGTTWVVKISCIDSDEKIIYNDKSSPVTIEENDDKLVNLNVNLNFDTDIIQEVFTAEEEKQISLAYLASDQYAVIGISPLSFDAEDSYYYDGSISVSGNKQTDINKNNISGEDISRTEAGEVDNYNQVSLDNYLRKQENEFEVENNIEEVNAKINSLQVQNTNDLGDEREFSVYDFSTGSYRKITAVLKNVSDHAYFFVDKEEDISSDTLSHYASEFDSNIFPTNMEYFASHQYESSHYDYDNNDRVIILFTQLDNDSGNGMVMGFFNSLDFSSSTNANEADMFYVNSYAVTNNMDNNVLSTIAHEFQHLIFFVEKTLYSDRTSNDIWINEGFSGLAEYLNGYYDYTGDRRIYSGDGNTGFFDNPEVESLLAWEGQLSDYGASNLFALYLYNRFSSKRKELIKDIISGDKDPVKVISDDYINFTELYQDWITTNIIHDEDLEEEFSYPVDLNNKPEIDVLQTGDSFSLKSDAQKYYYIEGNDEAVDISINLPDIKTGVIIYKGEN